MLLKLCNTNLSALGSFIAEHQHNISLGYLVEYLNPALLITMANKEDTPTFMEAVTGPNAAGFLAAMIKEYNTLDIMGTFDIVNGKPGMKVISSVWAFRRNKYPNGSIRSLKARFCAYGFLLLLYKGLRFVSFLL